MFKELNDTMRKLDSINNFLKELNGNSRIETNIIKIKNSLDMFESR